MTRLLSALKGQNQGRPPIWLMRQAGRYLPEYRAYKNKHRLYDLFQDPKAIVDITTMPLKRFPLDAAILFSDILTVLEGLNIPYDFQEGIGPVIEPITQDTQFNCRTPQEAYPHIQQSIQQLKQELSVPLLGFAGAPFTIASYLIEGRSSRDCKKTKQWLFQSPQTFQALLDQITQATIDYLHVQIDAGVDAIQLFDSWAQALSIWEFREFALKPMQAIVQAVKKRQVPIILFCRGSSLFAKELATLQPDAISIDWSGDIAHIRQQLPSITLQGNLDPMLLYAPKPTIAKALDRLLTSMEDDPAYIFNLGHGLLPDIPVDHVHYLVDYVHSRIPQEVS